MIRLEVTTCDGGSTGTGFAISAGLLVTAAHVVEGAAVIRVIEGTTSRAGEIVGLDPRADVALVEAQSELTGHQFDFAERAPEEADQVGILGYPKGEPLTYTQGEITGTNRKDGDRGKPALRVGYSATAGSRGGPLTERVSRGPA